MMCDEMRSKYQMEIDYFRKNFIKYQTRRIAIYGIGRRTASLLPGIRDFRIVGLLDREEGNVGKVVGGIPVISLPDAEKTADMLIINSDPTNYRIIYRRIMGTSLPVYYANGEEAEIPEESWADNPYWSCTMDSLRKAIDEHSVISFDFFDTLSMRKLLTPTDLFRLMEKKAKDARLVPSHFALAQMRQQVFANARELTLQGIYEVLQHELSMDDETTTALMHLEMDLEEMVCVPRRVIVDALKYSKKTGKEVYIVSDTYFLKRDFMRLVRRCGIDGFDEDHVFLSSEHKCSKQDGLLWEKFCGGHVGEKILHIGDNPISDGTQAEACGIDTFHIMSGKEMMESSSVAPLLSRASTLSDSVHVGLLLSRLFHDPFALAHHRGKVYFRSAEDFGYAVFGGVVLRFLMWLHGNAAKKGYDDLLFFARDGYFLLQDYEYLQGLLKETVPRLKYVPVSRRLLYIVTMETEEDLRVVAQFPYIGKFSDYVKSRFNLDIPFSDSHCHEEINAANDADKILEYLRPYKEHIWEEARLERDRYLAFLKKEGILGCHGKSATVDFSFYGTNQYYFQKMLGISMDGYYFSACYDKSNVYLDTCRIFGCFNLEDDPNAERSYVKRKSAFLESFLTAPYGMIRFVDGKGDFVCEEDKTNQRNFAVKIASNKGIQEYMRDYLDILGIEDEDGCHGNEAYSYYTFLDGRASAEKFICDGYYFDNDMVGSAEMPLEL